MSTNYTYKRRQLPKRLNGDDLLDIVINWNGKEVAYVHVVNGAITRHGVQLSGHVGYPDEQDDINRETWANRDMFLREIIAQGLANPPVLDVTTTSTNGPPTQIMFQYKPRSLSPKASSWGFTQVVQKWLSPNNDDTLATQQNNGIKPISVDTKIDPPKQTIVPKPDDQSDLNSQAPKTFTTSSGRVFILRY